MFVLRILDEPQPGLTWIGGASLDMKGPPELARIAPSITPDSMLVPDAVKVRTWHYLFRVDPNVSPGTILCNDVTVKTNVTNYEDKDKYTKARDCVTVVAPPSPTPPIVTPPVPPAVTPLAPLIAAPPVVKPPVTKSKPTRCKTKTVTVMLSKKAMNLDPPGNFRASTVANGKECRYANVYKHLRLKHSPKMAPRNPNGKITFWVSGNGKFVDILSVKYEVQGHRRGSVRHDAPYAITFLSRNFAGSREYLNEMKTTTAIIKVRLKPLTKHPN
jgi:hypothetical protein